MTSQGTGLHQWHLWNRAQASKLNRMGPRPKTSMGVGPSKGPLWEQDQANNIHRARSEPATFAGAGLSQQLLWEQSQASDLHGSRPEQALELQSNLPECKQPSEMPSDLQDHWNRGPTPTREATIRVVSSLAPGRVITRGMARGTSIRRKDE